jgi:GNAT superfamily N-acetyltransferase
MVIKIAQCDRDIDLCFPVMHQLRPHLLHGEFVSRIKHQQQQYNYQLAYLENERNITTLAGFRISESLAWGKYLYVDDLVTAASDRSQGYGDAMFNWLVEYAQSHECEQLHLDSGVQRFAAHRFYLKQRMEISSHHFSIKL